MVGAFVFPLLDAFLTILWVFLFVLWFWLVISVIVDVFASHDLGGVAKAIWVLLILIFPLVGVVVYLLARGSGMSHRRLQRAESAQHAYQEWADRFAGGSRASVADELDKLANLKDRGVITNEEFDRQKERLMG